MSAVVPDSKPPLEGPPQGTERLLPDLSIVCFGASAGGLGAYSAILSLLPADTGMAYIIVHHQAADSKSLLPEILPRLTKMPVVVVTDGIKVRADHLYVVPPGKQVTMDRDVFRIAPLNKIPGWP